MTAPALPLALPFAFDIELAISLEVPGKYPCALNGRPLMIDDGQDSGWAHQGIQQIRTQADSSTSPSEASLNPQGLWRRAQESWHHGAGQSFRDKTNADDARFRASKGIDPWTPYQMGLLPATDQKKAGASTNYRLVTCGSRLYLADGTHVYYTASITPDSPTWTDVTGYTGGAVLDLCSDGYTVYVTDGADIWTTGLAGTTAATSVNTLNATHLGFVKGRLMASQDNILYNITTIGTPPSALYTHFNADFEYVGFAQGHSAIYTAGFSGDKSQIFKIPVKDDGSGLDAPSECGEIPDGEVVTSIGDYLGFIVIGTTTGVRFAEPDASGNLTLGPLIPTTSSVLAFEGQDRYIWFGWTNYDSTSTGLGRMDLTQFTEDVLTGGRKPAYASDLMATAQGAVLSVASFQNLRVFTVSGVGVFAQDTLKVASGTITSGAVTFGLPDMKTSVEIDIATTPLAGSYAVSVGYDGGTAVPVGSLATVNTTSGAYPTAYTSAETFEVTLTLTRDGTATTTGPTITRWTLKVSPGANDGPAEYLMIPFLLHSTIQMPGGSEVTFDVKTERDYIKALRQSRTVVAYQDVDQSYQVIVENYEWHPYGLGYSPIGGFKTENGTMLTQLKRIA